MRRCRLRPGGGLQVLFEELGGSLLLPSVVVRRLRLEYAPGLAAQAHHVAAWLLWLPNLIDRQCVGHRPPVVPELAHNGVFAGALRSIGEELDPWCLLSLSCPMRSSSACASTSTGIASWSRCVRHRHPLSIAVVAISWDDGLGPGFESCELSALVDPPLDIVPSAHQLFERRWRSVHGLLQQSVEEEAPATRSAPVEAEGEFIEVVVQVPSSRSALMGSDDPALSSPATRRTLGMTTRAGSPLARRLTASWL